MLFRTAIPLLFGSTYAGLNQIAEGLKQLNQLATNGTERSVEDDRRFTGFMTDFLGNINGYGCWCMFNEKYVEAKGPVQDEVDGECKILIHGYRCVEIDAVARGEECDIVNKVYTPYNFFSAATALELECPATNEVFDFDLSQFVPDQCAIDMCLVEGRFTLAFFDQFFTETIVFDPALSHPDGQINVGPFDHTVECKINPNGSGKSELECCGLFYVNRFTYKTDEGARDCCDAAQKTFSTATHECCSGGGDDGTIQLLDQCAA